MNSGTKKFIDISKEDVVIPPKNSPRFLDEQGFADRVYEGMPKGFVLLKIYFATEEKMQDGRHKGGFHISASETFMNDEVLRKQAVDFLEGVLRDFTNPT